MVAAFAALVGGAPGLVALDVVRVRLRGVLLGAVVARADQFRFAALGLLAPAPLALHVLSVVDESETARAGDGVAEFFVLRFLNTIVRGGRFGSGDHSVWSPWRRLWPLMGSGSGRSEWGREEGDPRRWKSVLQYRPMLR